MLFYGVWSPRIPGISGPRRLMPLNVRAFAAVCIIYAHGEMHSFAKHFCVICFVRYLLQNTVVLCVISS